MSVTDSIALIFGVLGVWLTIKQSIWCWPAALISVVASVAAFYQKRLFGDMSLQLVYFVAGIYGWVYWSRNATLGFKVTKAGAKALLLLALVTLLQSVLYYYLLVYFKGERPFLDGLLTACSLSATYMMTKKWIENWPAWVFIDGAYVLLYSLTNAWLFALLSALYTIIAFYGWLKWRKAAL